MYMKRRVFVCAGIKFPRGDAGSNRIQYICKALQLSKYQIKVISLGKQEPNHFSSEIGSYIYDGIIYENLHMRKGILQKILSGRKTLDILERNGLSKDDLVIIYGSNSLYVKPIMDYCRKRKVKIYIDVVEWHQFFQYRFGIFDPRYLSNKYCFDKLCPRIGNIITLSNCLKEHFESLNCKVLNIPVLINSDEQKNRRVISSDNKIHLIYPGNPIHKDDIEVMLKGLRLLSDFEKERIRFHITGVSEKNLRKYLGDQNVLLDDLSNIVVFHNWMEYEQLLKLYSMVDFLYMSRPNNLVTKANFPSKIPELLAWGIVPIGNRVGDYYKYLKDGEDSILFNENTPEQCCEAIQRVLNMPYENIVKMKFKATKSAKQYFDYRLWVQYLDEFLKNDL